MKWRKLNRVLHRDIGYFFVGMTIIYSVSGIVLNHRRPDGDASLISRSEDIRTNPVSRENFNQKFINQLLEDNELEKSNYKSYYFLSENKVMIYLTKGHIQFNLQSGEGKLVTIKKRAVLTEFNFLHYNKPKQLWTWFSDIFAVGLIVIAITGLFIIRGKNGIRSRGAILVSLGIFIPLIFLFFYLWYA